MKGETFILLAGFDLIDLAKKYLPWKPTDEQMKRNPDWPGFLFKERFLKVLQYWRFDDSIPFDFYSVLRQFYPDPIPFSLLFSYSELNDVKNIKWIGDLADKWLMDIFSGESFYKRNKEYFTKSEVKYFLVCDWVKSNGTRLKMCDFSDLIDHFFNTKIRVNNLYLPLDVFQVFRDCFAHQVVIEYFKFLCNNKKYIKSKEEEIRNFCVFLRKQYIDNGQDFDFENMTLQKLKRLSDEWYVSNMFRDRIINFDHKIVQDYIIFICKKVSRFRDKEEEIRDILDFLRTEYINNGQDFSFENMTWQELKRLSDEWHLENEWGGDPYSRNYLNTKWEKSSIKDFSYQKDGKTWTIKEITTGESLYEEGEKMHHCVFSYAGDCIKGYCCIFSVSCKSGEDDSGNRIATLEISKNRELVQVRGPCNASIDNETAEIIKIWAVENKIDCGNYLSNRNQFYGQVA